MNPFKYHRAENLQRAKDQQNLDENAKYLGGGMTLLPAMKHGLIQPSPLIDISAIVELGEIQVDAVSVTIGAAIKHDRERLVPLFKRKFLD
jgi:carbon-monoxide dehydrogenase medium subunit